MGSVLQNARAKCSSLTITASQNSNKTGLRTRSGFCYVSEDTTQFEPIYEDTAQILLLPIYVVIQTAWHRSPGTGILRQ